jgi:hypothetical protein
VAVGPVRIKKINKIKLLWISARISHPGAMAIAPGCVELIKGQLDQVPDSTEQSDVKRHREDGSEPAFKRFVGQGQRSGGNIIHTLYFISNPAGCKIYFWSEILKTGSF